MIEIGFYIFPLLRSEMPIRTETLIKINSIFLIWQWDDYFFRNLFGVAV